MHAPIGITAGGLGSLFRRWAFVALAALALALALFGGGGNPASAQQVGDTFDSFVSNNANQRWIWSDGTTMYVSDNSADRVFAYNMSDKQYNSAEDFSTLSAAGNRDGTGLWGNDDTLWVADTVDDKLYAYNRSNKARDTGKDITLSSANGRPRGIWSDGTTMWVADSEDDIIYAYGLSSGNRDSGKDISMVGDGVNGPMDLWSDGVVMWVSSDTTTNIHAFNMPGAASIDVTNLSYASTPTITNEAGGIWSDGRIMWAADSGVQIEAVVLYLPQVTGLAVVGGTSSSARVGWDPAHRGDRYTVRWKLTTESWPREDEPHLFKRATVDGRLTTSYTIRGLDSSNRYEFDVRVESVQDGVQIGTSTWAAQPVSFGLGCVNGVALNNRASASASGAWSAGCPSETHAGSYAKHYSFDLAERKEVRVGVNAGDKAVALYLRAGGAKTGAYLAAPTSSADSDAYKVLDPGTYTVEVVNLNPGETGRFTLSINTRTLANLPPAGFDLHADNFNPQGVWSDGTTMWVADSAEEQIYAYNLNTRQHDSGKSFTTLDPANENPHGLWSDGTTMWVSDPVADKVFAYNLRSKATSSQDFNTLAAGNTTAYGLWSDGMTMYVADASDKIFAYNLSTKQPDSNGNFDPVAGTGVFGIWSDGTTMWVSDFSDDKLYAYGVADKARNSGREFDVARTPAGIWSDGNNMWVVNSLTKAVDVYNIEAETPPPPRDYSFHAANDGPQGIYSDGVTLWVANADPSVPTVPANNRIFAYRLRDMSRDTGKEPVLPSGADYATPRGVWVHPDGTMYVVDGQNLKVVAYSLSTRRAIPGKGFDLDSANSIPQGGIWSDGTTMWVVNRGNPAGPDDKLFAYRLSDGQRDSAKDFDTLNGAGNNGPRDLWSDGTTMWVVDVNDNRIYAYNLATKAHESGKTIYLDPDNTFATGLWSDGYTMWVTDWTDKKLFHYNIASGNHITTLPVPNSCHTVSLTAAGTTQGEWGPGPADTDISCRASATEGYARYYDFHLTRQSRVTITLTSDQATPRVFLRGKRSQHWQILAGVPNEDRWLDPHYIGAYHNGGSRISETLPPGSYTIQAASNEDWQVGEFTLQVSGSGITAIPALPDPVLCADTPNQTLSAGTETTGQWGPGCESGTAHLGHFARFYEFDVPERKSVTVTLRDTLTPASDYLFVLRRGTVVAKSGTAPDEANDVTFGAILGSAFNEGSRASLTMDLQEGKYFVEALGSDASPFAISYRLANPSAASNCFGRSIRENQEVEGRWFNDCDATNTGKYAAYYDLRVTGSAAKRVNIRLHSSETPTELILWRASDFTGSRSERTLKTPKPAPVAAHFQTLKEVKDSEGNVKYISAAPKPLLSEDLQPGNYVIEARSYNPHSHTGLFKLSVTTGVEPPDYVRENCGEVRYDVRSDGMPLTPGDSYGAESSRTVASSTSDREPGYFSSDVLIRLGQNNPANCTGDRRDGYPVWHFVFALGTVTFDARSTSTHDLTVGVGRTSGISSDRRHRWNWSVYDLTNFNAPTYTLRKLTGGSLDESPVVPCRTDGETPPCLTGGEYEDLAPGTYALTVTMDPPASDPTRVTQAGPFAVSFTTTLGFGFGPQGPGGPDTGEPPIIDPVTFSPPVFSAEAEDQTARLYTPFTYTVPEATDPKGGAVTYRAVLSDGNALPEWLSFDADARTFSGTPAIGDYPATLTIVVNAGDDSYYQQTDSTFFTLTVARPAENLPPMFHAGEEITLEVAENSPAGTKVGTPLTAFDANGDAFAYVGMDGADGAAFALSGDGQLTTIDGVTYDYETKSSYQFMALVMETDTAEGHMTGVLVTVNLTDVAEGNANGDGGNNDGANGGGNNDGNNNDGANGDSNGDGNNNDGNNGGGNNDGNNDGGNDGGNNGGNKDGGTQESNTEPPQAPTPTPVTACKTVVSALTAEAQYAGSWDDAACKAHHQDSRARYFEITPSAQTTLTIALSAGALYVSQDAPKNGWGTVPGPGYDHRKSVRSANSKLTHSGAATATLTLAAGKTYTVEAAGTNGAFTLTLTPQ